MPFGIVSKGHSSFDALRVTVIRLSLTNSMEVTATPILGGDRRATLGHTLVDAC